MLRKGNKNVAMLYSVVNNGRAILINVNVKVNYLIK